MTRGIRQAYRMANRDVKPFLIAMPLKNQAPPDALHPACRVLELM
jgi:hypothetical protein